jgi:3-oxoacyl-[acyl-carrier protein] reductase
MIGLTKSLAREVASRKVTVNALALGMVATDMASALDETYQQKILDQIPLGRFAEADEVARIACFPVVQRREIHHRTGDSGGWRAGDVRI